MFLYAFSPASHVAYISPASSGAVFLSVWQIREHTVSPAVFNATGVSALSPLLIQTHSPRCSLR